MSGAMYLCTTDDVCPRHGKYIYFCRQCHEEWEVANPRTAKAIRAGRTAQTVTKAREQDRAARAGSAQ